jgi:hypothetical protein
MLAIDATAEQVIASLRMSDQDPARGWWHQAGHVSGRTAGSGRRQPGGQRSELGFWDPCRYQF